jgi:argininosuccinate lyase
MRTASLPLTPLWAKDLPLDAEIHRFTVGRDPELDLALYGFDCIASAAHVRMLESVKLLTSSDASALLAALKLQHAASTAGTVRIENTQEDCHTALEAALVAATGEAGKRIHLARSRNDQVLVALRLYLRAGLNEVASAVHALAHVLAKFAEQFEHAEMPGYTHMRKAMPGSFGLWATGYAEGLVEELDASIGVHARIDRCPLGAAAGFGVPLPIDRELTAKLLGFASTQRAATDCINSRGRHEQALLDWCVSIAGSLEKLLWDLAIFSTEEYGYLQLPDAYTTGSSIMPQKRNPDVVELARAKCRALRGMSETHRNIMTGLPGSYHRDFQLGKAPLMEGVQTTLELLRVLTALIPTLIVNQDKAKSACTDELYAAAAAYQLVADGMAFRDAYKVIAAQITAAIFVPPAQINGTIGHVGTSSNLALGKLNAELDLHHQTLVGRRDAYAHIATTIWNRP